MDKNTLFKLKISSDFLIMPSADYEDLKARIATGLLTFFDRIEYGANINSQNYELIIRGYRKEWVAINTFFIQDWYLMNQDEFIAAMASKVNFLQENYGKLFN